MPRPAAGRIAPRPAGSAPGLLALLQRAPHHLARAALGQAVDKLHQRGHLVGRHVGAAPVAQLGLGQALMPGTPHHDGLDGLAAVGIGCRDDAGLGDAGVGVHQVLDLARPDLEAARVDHALEPVGHEEIAIGIDAADVAGAEEAFALKLDEGGFGRIRPAPVTVKHHGPMHDDFARLADGQFLQPVRVDDAGVAARIGHAQALLLGRVVRVAVAGRGRLGEAIAFDVAQAPAALQLLCDRLRHGRAAAADGDQAAEVEAVHLGAGQQIDDHGGDVGPARDAVGLDQLGRELALPARHQHQGRTKGQGAVQHDDEAGDVEHRHHAEHHVLVAGIAPQRAGEDVVLQAAVPVHAALGVAGGAAGVGQQREVVGADVHRRRCRRAGQRFGPGGGAGRQWQVGVEPVGPARWQGRILGRTGTRQHLGEPGDQQLRRRDAGGQPLGAELHAGDGQYRAAVVEQVAQLGRLVHRVDRHHDRAEAHQGVVRDDELRAVLQIHQHALALADAALMQPGRQPRDLGGELGIGRRVAEEDQRRSVWETARVDGEVVGQGRGRRADRVGHAGRPERVMGSGHAAVSVGLLATTR
mmetsp:Transcript_21532/g.83661  ORF Transcript_21532/g.83661 Transcript_21532/m.83661 type:complete len:584 (+) Transcript_21532:5464-7215(+)